jgi:hypothetical protein
LTRVAPHRSPKLPGFVRARRKQPASVLAAATRFIDMFQVRAALYAAPAVPF